MIQQKLALQHLRHLDPKTFFQAYGVDLQLLYPWEGVVEPPFGAAWATLAPSGSTKRHQHQEAETFFVARGRGRMTIDGESFDVAPGSVIFQRPFEQHILSNLSPTEELLFLTVWWEDRRLWSLKDRSPKAAEGGAAPVEQRRVMVTAAPPTPNGDLHLGHFSGPYLSADIHARYLRLRGIDSAYACGTDDHCMFVERRGEQLGMTGEAATEHFANAITESLDLAGLDLALFVRPARSESFKRQARAFFDHLYKTGKLEIREGPSPYCESCQRYLFEADIRGHCPHCERNMVGNTCEECGRINDTIDLLEPRCTSCDGKPTERLFKRLFFPLHLYADQLAEYHRQTAMSPRLRAFCERLLADGLPDVAVSHVSSWGLPVPLEDEAFAEQKLYVWFEMAARYLAYAEQLATAVGSDDGFRHYWQAEEASIVQFFGFDNSFYYALFLPALYLAYDARLRLPTALISNELYRLDGKKFSTTRQHAILGRELFGRIPRDMARFYLAYSSPEREPTSFTLAELAATVDRELLAWNSWLRELGEKGRRSFAGLIPATGDWTDEHQAFFASLKRLMTGAERTYEAATFSPQEATRILCELVRQARRFGKGEDVWQGVPDREQERRTGLALELLAARTLAVLAFPIMPEFATRLWRDLGHAGSPDAGTWEDDPSWLPASQELGSLGETPYFPSVTPILFDPSRPS